MAHYARLDENNFVLDVIVVSDTSEQIDGIESEEKGIEFCVKLTGHLKWKKTSYNRRIRRNYAGPGYKYDEILDVFIPPKPHEAWTLDSQGYWQPPIPRPDDGNVYAWNDETLSWDFVASPIPPPQT
jgi:hypothetical protein